jgi:hypothetical protein
MYVSIANLRELMIIKLRITISKLGCVTNLKRKILSSFYLENIKSEFSQPQPLKSDLRSFFLLSCSFTSIDSALRNP